MVAALLATASVAALGGAGCGESTPADNGDVTQVQSAITQITISGRVTKTGNVGVPNIPIRLNGQSQAWALTNATGNYSFTINPGSYSIRPEEAACAFTPDVVNLNNLTANTTRNFTVTGTMCTGGTPTPNAKAMILVDSRLYAQLATNIDQYKAFAEARRGFAIDLRKDQQFDSMTFTAVKQYIVNARAANPAIEGVLFIGNIKLPSFYKARLDLSLTRLYPRYYEDLDGVFSKRYATGEIDPVCPPVIADGDVKCVISPRAVGEGPVTIIPHDFDDMDFGPNPGARSGRRTCRSAPSAVPTRTRTSRTSCARTSRSWPATTTTSSCRTAATTTSATTWASASSRCGTPGARPRSTSTAAPARRARPVATASSTAPTSATRAGTPSPTPMRRRS